ncbi:hypothetical protein RclHR1_26610001 [Rhizophagus clarus]|uniref:Uncharacterized protein n=1 Tax=Rhizophagus clarus TaxID=94130 RepID=A0A2Z6RVM3_9GLOM|nr:hypothetical protein RclHR1_26610001 [Rhizophagus clarus]
MKKSTVNSKLQVKVQQVKQQVNVAGDAHNVYNLRKHHRDEDLIDEEVVTSTKKTKLDNKNKQKSDEFTLDDDILNISKSHDLYVNGVNICFSIDKWCRTAKYIEEIHKQDLLQYHIIDTIESSSTHAQVLFRDKWDDLINVIEDVLTPNDFDLTEQQDMKIYLKEFMERVLENNIKTKKNKLRSSDEKWKQQAIKLAKML